mmetsp:Transcript_44858/g.89594  ORF Transcript_44858/g.89594 Transcript_44858/m.89594 type:complete len:92 (+) Transcript_44858:46-321(+)
MSDDPALTYGLAAHYRQSSHTYGEIPFNAQSLERQHMLNGHPSAAFLPDRIGKTAGTNGRSIAPPGTPAFGQTRTVAQQSTWTLAARLETS